jgi:hypothetical protein
MTTASKTSGITIRCPWCKAKGRIRRPGAVKCPRCRTAFTVGDEVLEEKRHSQEKRLDLLPEKKLDLAPVDDDEESPSTHGVCARHPRATAHEACVRCGDFVCASCLRFARGKVRCPDCSERADGDRTSAPEVPFGVGSVVEHTFRAAWQTGWKGLLMAFLPSVAHLGATIAVALCFSMTHSLVPTIATGLGVFGLWLWVHARSQAGMFALTRASLGGEPLPSFLAAFEAGNGRALGLIVTQLLAGLAIVGIAFLAAFVGAVTRSDTVLLVASIAAGALILLRLVRWSVLAPVIFEENVAWTSALSRSSERVAGRSLQVFAILVIGLLGLCVIPVLVQSMPFVLGLVAQVVLGTASALVTASGLATLYFALRTGVRV